MTGTSATTGRRSGPPIWVTFPIGFLATRPSGFGEVFWQSLIVFFAASGAVHIAWALWHRQGRRTSH